jgi:hypothetical protein
MPNIPKAQSKPENEQKVKPKRLGSQTVSSQSSRPGSGPPLPRMSHQPQRQCPPRKLEPLPPTVPKYTHPLKVSPRQRQYRKQISPMVES